MAGPGQATPLPVPAGAAEVAHLHAAGFSDQEVAKYQADKSQTLLHAGFTPAEIEAHWGISDPHSPEVARHVANNITKAGVNNSSSAWDAFEAGWGTSVAGIVQHIATGQDPNAAFHVKPPTGFWNGLLQTGGQLLGDAGTMTLGAIGGTAAGAAIPVAGETGIGELGGAVAGAAGAGIVSQGTREVLLDAYNRHQIHSARDLVNVVAGSVKRTLLAGVESAPFGVAGPVAGKLAEAGAGKVVSAVGGGAAATTLGVGTSAAINQHVPDAQDFAAAAAIMLVTHGAVKAGAYVNGVFKPSDATLHVQSNLQEIYRRNGTTPWDAVNQAKDNPGIRQEILQQDVNGNSVAPRLHANAPTEPPPIKPAGGEPDFSTMKNVTPAHLRPKSAPIVTSFEDLSTALEGSKDSSVSPAGAIGKHQIMLGTARQYGFGEGMSQTELAQWLHDPANNAAVFHKIAADLHARFHGDMNAMLIAYNAGPGRAAAYVAKGPGTELEAIPDRNARGGIRYESRPSNRDESFLPLETQKYLANGRRRSGSTTDDTGAPAGKELFPDANRHAPVEEEGAGGGGGGKPPGGVPPLALGEEPPDGSPRRRYSFDEATDEIMANIGEPPGGPGWRDLINPDTLRTQFLSELTPAYNIDSGLVREGLLDRAKNVGQEDMFRQTYASDSRTGAFIRFGILKIGNNEITVEPGSPSILKAADEVREAGGTMRGWTSYMLSKRTRDKKKQGIDTGFNQEAAEDQITDPEARKYEKATETFNKVMTGGLEYARDSGYLSQAQVDAMVRDNPAYISMRRIMGDDASFGTGRKGFVPREALKRMEGSDRSIVDPIHATLDNLRVLVSMADRNRAIGSIIGQVEMGKLDELGLEKLEWRPGEAISAKPGDPFKPYGFTKDGADDPNVTYQSLLAERSQKGLAANEFIYYRNGIAEKWSAKSPALADLIRKASGPGEINVIGKVFDKVAGLERAGIVLDPSFPTRVTLRHQITAFIADSQHPPPFITLLSGIHDVLTQNGVFQEWVANGGAGTALQDMDINWLQRDMENTFEDQGIYSRMWNRVQHPIEAYQFMSERMDAAARVGYYKRAIGAGLEPLKAATMSRTAYLDYAERQGLEAVNSLARKVPFLRPKLLGTNQFLKAFSERPFETLGWVGVAVSGVAAALYAANYFADKDLPDEEKSTAIPRWVRDTHYVAPPIAGVRIKFPYPPVVGTFFGGMMNRFLDYFLKSDPHAFDGWARGLLGEYNVPEMMPTALRVPLEVMANHSYFTGHPIVPTSVEAADGYMQYTNATTEPAKALARWLGPQGANMANVSPIQLEYLIKGWTGDIGMGVLKAVNGRMADYKPPWEMADIPVVGTFFVRNPGLSSQQIEDFYTDLKSMEAAHADWALALKHGDEGEIAAAARGPFYGLKVVGGIAQSLHVMAAAVVAVNKDTTLQPAEKSQAVDQVISGMIRLSIMGSGITATLQGKQPSKEFRDLDKDAAISTLVKMPTDGVPVVQ